MLQKLTHHFYFNQIGLKNMNNKPYLVGDVSYSSLNRTVRNRLTIPLKIYIIEIDMTI